MWLMHQLGDVGIPLNDAEKSEEQPRSVDCRAVAETEGSLLRSHTSAPRHLCALFVRASERHSLVDGFGSMAAIAGAGIGELVERSLLSDEKAEALYDDITHAEPRREDDSRNSNSSGPQQQQQQRAQTQADVSNNMILDSPDSSFAAFGR